jgi:hypothetical protein
MAAALVTIICIAMLVVGGMTLSQGILTSTDSAAASVESISVREGDMMRTDLDTLRAASLSWGDDIRITVKNSGQIKLASFDRWDVIVNYASDDGTQYCTWLPYTTATPVANEWEKARIGLNGPAEYFEPGILNPGEEMVILAHVNPMPGDATTGEVSLSTPNGIYDSIPLVIPGYLRLTPQSESINLAGIKYYEMVEAATADGPAAIAGTTYTSGETGRKLLRNTADASRSASFIYPLTGITQIPAEEWTVNYRTCVSSTGAFPQTDSDTWFNMDIIVRQADGSIRETIATSAATAYASVADAGNWVTLTGIYSFPGYSVVDENDYLEIVYYGETAAGPDNAAGTMQISFDDSSLPLNDQTRIEAL